MLRRAGQLTARARERIRAAREHDPHGWHSEHVGDPEPIDFVRSPYDDLDDDAHADDETTTAPPLGSPEAGAPDLDSAAGVSGPPEPTTPEGGSRARRPLPRAPQRRGHAEDDVPFGLRTAAAWSWRLIVVIAGFYVLLYAAAYVRVVIIPVFVALLLAALLQPGAASRGRRGGGPSLGAPPLVRVGRTGGVN